MTQVHKTQRAQSTPIRFRFLGNAAGPIRYYEVLRDGQVIGQVDFGDHPNTPAGRHLRNLEITRFFADCRRIGLAE